MSVKHVGTSLGLTEIQIQVLEEKKKSFAPNSLEINLRDTSLMQYPNFPTTSQTEHRLSF